MGEIRVNKSEAARRQIDIAIRLLFDNEDPVPIHTLAAAGFRIVRDLAKSHPKSYLDKAIKNITVSEKEGEFWKAMHKPANFFKHAEFDQEDILDNVQEEINDSTLFLATIWYQDLGFRMSPEMAALSTWFQVLHPDFILDASPIKSILGKKEFEEFRSDSRIEKLKMGKMLISFARQQMYGT